MKFRIARHIIVDEQKLDLLLRLGCNNDTIFAVICGKKVAKTGDKIIDELLESLASKKEHKNWGGARKSAGRKRNQVEFQDEFQVDNQDNPHLGAKAIAITSTGDIYNTSGLSTTRDVPSLDDVLSYAAEQDSMAGCGGFVCPRTVAQDFYDYYASIGWTLPNDAHTPVRDWRPLLRRWARNPDRFRRADPPDPDRRNIDDPDNFVI